MIKKIIHFSITNKLIIILLMIGLIIQGVISFKHLKIDALPDITNVQVQIIAVVPALGASDVEKLITIPIEQANANIAHIKEIRSFSRFGLAVVTVVFEENVDIFWARQQVSERINIVQKEIPPGLCTPTMGPISTGLGEVYQYVLRPEKGYENKFNLTELRTIQDWIIRKKIIGIKGVADVSALGGDLKQYEIAVNNDKLKALGVDIDEIITAVEKNNQNTGGTYIERGPTAQFIRTEGLVNNIEDIKQIVVKFKKRELPIFVRDVAEVKIGKSVKYGATTFNYSGEVVGAVVMMTKGENSSEVVKRIKKEVIEIQKILPKGVVIEPFLDRTKMINSTFSTIEANLLEGCLIIVFILIIILGNFRAGIIVASMIPLSFLFAIIMMDIFDISANLMSLGALDFGLIVDGAIIILEAILFSLHNKLDFKTNGINQIELDVLIQSKANKMMRAAMFGQIIILIVYLPIFSFEGIEGKMFKPMAQTVAFALIGAFLLSITYIPTIASLILKKTADNKVQIGDKIMHFLEKHFKKVLVFSLKKAGIIIGFIVVLFIISIYTLNNMGGEFIPTLEEGDFAVETKILTGSNLKTTIEKTQKLAYILKTQFPEVEKVVVKIGSGEIPTDPMPIEAGDMMIILKPKKEWTSATSFNELSQKMQDAISVVPGVLTSFQYPVQMRFNELISGAKQDVVCKLFGENLDTLSFYADIIANKINLVKGANDITKEVVTGVPQIVIKFNREMLGLYNINIETLNKNINAAFAGFPAGFVFEDERKFDIVVRLDNFSRKNINDVKNLLINTENGSQIPLSQLATIELKNSVNQIQREKVERRITVGFNAKGRDVQSIVDELKLKLNEVQLPSGYEIKFGGSFENLQAAKERLLLVVPITLVLIFLMLFFAFKSIKQALIIYSAIPFSAIGGIFLLYFRDIHFSISAAIGFIALFGVAVLNGIVLLTEYNKIKKNETKNTLKIVLKGTVVRLRPVLITALVASFGFLPMAISTNAGANVQRPLATVVIGGLISSTILTLIILPMLFILIDYKKRKFSFKNNKKTITTLCIILFFITTNAQKNISLEDAIDAGLRNNYLVQEKKIVEGYNLFLKNSKAAYPSTNITTEYGNFNSDNFDYKVAISQSFNSPSTHKSFIKLFQANLDQSITETKIIQQSTKINITKQYYAYLIKKIKEEYLKKIDTILHKYKSIIDKSLALGESTQLEKLNIENKILQNNIKISDNEQEINQSLILFNHLLNVSEKSIPKIIPFKYHFNYNPTMSVNNENPVIVFFENQDKILKQQQQLEIANLKPTFDVGITNQTFNENSFVLSHHINFIYWSINTTLHIPIFTSNTQTKIKSYKILQDQNKMQYNAKLAELKTTLESWKTEYFQLINDIEINEKKIIPNLLLMESLINKQLNLGQINYLDFSEFYLQYINNTLSYLDKIEKINNITINMDNLIK